MWPDLVITIAVLSAGYMIADAVQKGFAALISHGDHRDTRYGTALRRLLEMQERQINALREIAPRRKNESSSNWFNDTFGEMMDEPNDKPE